MENNELNRLIDKYKLSEEEHGAILERLKKDIFFDQTPQKDQSILFVIGQPGCGKTTFIQNSELRADYININSDDYRHFSKYSDEILSQYPTYYSKLTNFDAHLWGDELFLYGINNGYSVLREKAPTDYSLLETIKNLAVKYDLKIYVVVTGNLTSLLATRERYEEEIAQGMRAKLSSIDAHNKCYDLLPNYVSECIKLGVRVSYIVPESDTYRIINVENDGLSMLEKIRHASNKKSCVNFEERINKIKIAMRNRNASQQQFEELSKIEEIYINFVNKEKSKSISSTEQENQRWK